MHEADARTFIFHGPLRDLAQYRAFAELAGRLKCCGRVLVNVAAVSDKAWFELPEGGSPWHEYAAYNPALFKFFPHPKIARHLPEEWVARNRELLLAKAAILRELDLGAAFWGYEIAFLPESFFAEHPHLRGPRMDHPRRSRKEAFAFCPDLEETQEMMAWMMAELVRQVPELGAYIWRTNDAGGGLCWAAAQYSGPNGPRHCQGLTAGERVRNVVEALHRGAAALQQAQGRPCPERKGHPERSRGAAGGGEVEVHIDHSNFWQREDELVARMLPEGTRFYQRDRAVAYLSTGLHGFYPVLGLFDPLAVIRAADRLLDPDVRVVVMDFRCMYERDSEPLEAVEKVIEIAEATRRAFPQQRCAGHPAGRGNARVLAAAPRGTRQRLDLLRDLCRQWAGEASGEALFEALYAWHEALQLKQAVAWEFHPHYLGVSMRYLTRPLLIAPEELRPEEEEYFLPHIFNPHEGEARSDYIDFHGGRIDLGRGEQLALAPVQRAISEARRAAAVIEGMGEAPQGAWLRRFAAALRVWASIIRSCHNFYFGQVIRDRNRTALSTGPRIPPKRESWTGDADLLAWNELMRDEMDNTNELISLLESGGLEALSVAPDRQHEDTFFLGPDIITQLRTKQRLMREHWLDGEKWLASPHK